MIAKLYRYVTHARVRDYLDLGWHIAQPDLGPHHRDYAVLMAWLCECKIVEPTNAYLSPRQDAVNRTDRENQTECVDLFAAR